jgi:hypothetical protein
MKSIMNADHAETRPLAYGYLRLHTQDEDDDLGKLEAGMRERADRDGYRFVTTFHEYDGGFGGFRELINSLKRAGARRVIVPSFEHISSHPLMRCHLLGRFEQSAAEVFTVDGELLTDEPWDDE